jgi:hypothetical protein
MLIMSQEGDENNAGELKFHDDNENTNSLDRQAANKPNLRVRAIIVLLVIGLVIGAIVAGYYYYRKSSYRGNPLNFR